MISDFLFRSVLRLATQMGIWQAPADGRKKGLPNGRPFFLGYSQLNQTLVYRSYSSGERRCEPEFLQAAFPARMLSTISSRENAHLWSGTRGLRPRDSSASFRLATNVRNLASLIRAADHTRFFVSSIARDESFLDTIQAATAVRRKHRLRLAAPESREASFDFTSELSGWKVRNNTMEAERLRPSRRA